MPSKISNSTKESVIKAYVPGLTSMVELASKYKLDRSTIKKILTQGGVPIVYPKYKQKIFGDHDNDRRFKHGMTKSSEFNIWQGIIARCCVESNQAYAYYGGRGITVCDRWKNSFENFYQDMGPRPSKAHSINRIDNDGNYNPHNCKWATQTEQANNTSSNKLITYKDNTKTLIQWASVLGIPYNTLWARIFTYGWDTSKAFETPVSNHVKLLTYSGESLTVDEWAKKLGISRRIIRYRLDEKGWSVEEALETPVRKQKKRKHG